MKCRICGSEGPKGAKLCKDCAAARKRAFAATVTEPMLLAAAGAPSVSQPRFAPRPARPRNPQSRSPAISPLQAALDSERKPVAAARVTSRRRLRLAWPVTVVGVAGLVLLATIAAVVNRRNHDASAEVSSEPPVATSPPPAIVAPESQTSAGTPEMVGPPEPPHKAPRARKPAASNEAQSAPVIVPQVVTVDPPPRPVAQASRMAEPVRLDPLQILNEALSGCARRDMLDRPTCEQRARVQYCGNAWGQVPQCPIGPGTDHGQ